MLKRYTSEDSGKKRLLAKIYTKEEHNIPIDAIDPYAIKICRRLKREGYEAFIVGGAVRDLLQNKIPKDFDIATDALPKKIRHFFWNSRIIGKRFKLVHVHIKNKIFEVSTFRSDDGPQSENIFGTIEQDVKRRDFSINALFYCPISQQILDFVEGMKDIREKRVRSLIPLEKTFQEDPVRIIRGIKYAATTGFRIEGKLKKAMVYYAPHLEQTPSSRLTEELFKIIESKKSASILTSLFKLGIFKYIQPKAFSLLSSDKRIKKELINSCKNLDKILSSGKELNRGVILSYYLRPFIKTADNPDIDMLFYDFFMRSKEILFPLTPPNVDVEIAVKQILKLLGITVPHNKRLSIKKSKRKALQKTAGPQRKNTHRYRHKT